MELEIFHPNPVTLEMIICYMSQALALIVEQYLDMILLAIHSDFVVKISQEKGNISSALVCEVREHATENDNGVEPVDDAGQGHSDSDYHVDGNGYLEDQINDEGDWNSGGSDDDEEGGDGGTGSSDGDDDENEEDDEDGYWLSDDGDDDDDDEDEDEEDESFMDREATKETFWAAHSNETADSESDEDEPGYGYLLKHAREVYKPTSFIIFEHEYKKSRTIDVHVKRGDFDRKGRFFEYDVQKLGHRFDYRKHRVIAWPMDGTIQCDCKYFDVAGILCCHALTALGRLRIVKIPEQYILQRHTKAVGADLLAEESSSPDCNHQSLSIETGGASKEVAEDGLEMNMNLIDAPLLRHAREVYVPDEFLKFQEEYKQSEYVFLSRDRETHDPTLGIVLDCTIIYPRRSKCYNVHAETQVGRVDCSCNGFQKTGALCSHALCVLDSLCIERIPDQYISMSSRKDPGHKEVRGIHGENYSELASFVRYNSVMDRLESLFRKASKTEEASKFVTEGMRKLLAKFEDSSYGKENSCETGKASMDDCERVRTEDVNGYDIGIGPGSDRILLKCMKRKMEEYVTACEDTLSPSHSPPLKSQKKSESSCSNEGTPVQDKKL